MEGFNINYVTVTEVAGKVVNLLQKW